LGLIEEYPGSPPTSSFACTNPHNFANFWLFFPENAEKRAKLWAFFTGSPTG
jgi:hypothetical protein